MNEALISKEHQKKYLSRRQGDLQTLLAALGVRDEKPLIRIGHQLKGSALTYGFELLGVLGEQIEDAAKTNNWPALEKLIVQFEKALKTYHE